MKSCRNGGQVRCSYKEAQMARFDDSGENRGIRRAMAGLLLVVVLVVFAASSTSCVHTGHVGVVTTFGRVTGRTMGEGIHLVNPVSRVHELDIRTREIKERASV